MIKLDELSISIRDASEDFLSEQQYDWHSEFKKRRMYSGTRMPLTYNCYNLKVKFYVRPGREDYADKEIVIDAEYILTEIAKRKLDFLKQETDLERTTVGTIATWFLRKNERVRQTKDVASRSRDPDWKALQTNYPQVRDVVIERVYIPILQKGIDYLESIVEEEKWEEFMANVSKYISDMKKSQTSMVSSYYNRYPYKNLLKYKKPRRIVVNFIKLLKLIRDNFFTKKRLNPKYILSALRNRPLYIEKDKDEEEKFTETESSGILKKSREANGQPPFSLFWMFIYAIKKKVLIAALNAIEEVYGIEFIDPIRYKDFYFRFTQKQDGLYLFGDNGLLIVDGKIEIMYDLSLSDVAQGWIRRDGERNFSFFLRLNSRFDCGSTGDALTTVWNIEGQVFIWWCYKKGLLSTKKSWPEIKELVEETDLFVGHYWSEKLQDWMTKGVRLTTDNAKKMISFQIERGKTNEVEWEHKENIPANEFLSLAISSGMLEDCRLTKFYAWIKAKNEDIYDEELGVVEQIKKAEEIPGFMDLTEVNLDELAVPYILIH